MARHPHQFGQGHVDGTEAHVISQVIRVVDTTPQDQTISPLCPHANKRSHHGPVVDVQPITTPKSAQPLPAIRSYLLGQPPHQHRSHTCLTTSPRHTLTLHTQHMGNALILQPPTQPQIVAVSRVPSHPTKGYTSQHRTAQHDKSEPALGSKEHAIRHSGVSTTLPSPSPRRWQVQLPINKNRAPLAAISQKHPDLAVLHLSRRLAVLPLHSHRPFALLQKPQLIHHQHRLLIPQMLHHVLPQVIPNSVLIPAVPGQQPLHPVGRGITNVRGQLPAILALHRSQQTLQVGQRTLMCLRTTESTRNALVQRPEFSLQSQHFPWFRFPLTHNQPHFASPEVKLT